jgi:cephalosporin-C deacetylase
VANLSLPEDIQDFWLSTAEEASAFPLEYERLPQREVLSPGFLIDLLRFRSSTGGTLHGWIAYQAGAFQDPGFVWLAPYGRESVLPNEYGTRFGFVSLSFNFHGEPAFHREKYEPRRGYFGDGAELPETWIFRRMFQNAVIATRILADLPETDSTKLAAMGMSQGGGISIWLGAWCSLIQSVCADMPFLGNVMESVLRPAYRYPLKELWELMNQLPLGEERIRNTVSYFDTVNQARFCDKPTQLSLGLKDPAATPAQVRAIYDSLPGHKHLVTYEIGHDWTPLMVDTNRTWLMETLGV